MPISRESCLSSCTDRPEVESPAATSKARMISEGLIYDHNTKIDQAVRDLLVTIKDDDYLALACMQRLVGRGYDREIEDYCKRRLKEKLDKDDTAKLNEMLDRLGWTQFHVAIARNDVAIARRLAGDKKLLDTAARNGETALH